jgi:hypothetical protein
METVAIDRKKLYEQIWSIPASRLALLYGISDVGLAKACKRYDIPRPARGYWARLAAGQRVRKTPLPRPNRADEQVCFKGWNMTEEAVQTLSDGHQKSSEPAVQEGAAVHRLAEATRSQLLSANADHDGLHTTGTGALDVRVASANIERAVSIIDMLVKLWESRNGSVIAKESDDGALDYCQFAIGPDSLGVQLTENLDEAKPVTDPSRQTGRLALHILGGDDQQFRRRWSDTKSQRLEKMLGGLVETLANALAAIRQERLDAECVERQKERVHAIRKVLSRDASREFYSRQELMQNVQRWVDARNVRGYLADLKSAVDAGRVTYSDSKQIAEWFDWASRFADWIDPIQQGPLPEVDQISHQNVTAAELDLTKAARTIVDGLGVADTDSLYRLSLDEIREAYDGRIGPIWNELTRVLESLGYDVAKRQEASSWW